MVFDALAQVGLQLASQIPQPPDGGHPPHGLSGDIMSWALSLANSHWILVALFAFCVIDGFFPVFPSEILIIALSSLAMSQHGHEVVPLWAVLLVGATGAFVGDMITYRLGRAIPVARIPFLNSGRGLAAYRTAKRLLVKRGSLLIFSARFIPLGRTAVNICAGATHFKFKRFMPTDAAAVITWATYGVIIGSAAGAALRKHPFVAVAVGVVGGVLAGMLMDKLATWAQKRFGGAEVGSEEDHFEETSARLGEEVAEDAASDDAVEAVEDAAEEKDAAAEEKDSPNDLPDDAAEVKDVPEAEPKEA